MHLGRREKTVQLMGTAYLLTPDMYSQMLASEGGGIAYAEIELCAEELASDNAPARPVSIITTRLLLTVLKRGARPSVRYLGCRF